MFNYLFITNKPDIAKYVESCGVQRIFVDLEINGKEGRQGHLDTVISRHSMEDISKIKSVLNTSELLVRLNPLYEGSEGEIDQAISCGADILMLPMFNSVEEVREFGALIDGRAKFIPLVETISAAEHIDEIHDLDCVDELHIGLNDLHLEMKLKFMFELIANGTVDRMTRKLTKPFGIGGLARVGQGKIPGELVMAQHVRLKSSGVILSRAFHMGANTVEELNASLDFKAELDKINKAKAEQLQMSTDELNQLATIFKQRVDQVSE